MFMFSLLNVRNSEKRLSNVQGDVFQLLGLFDKQSKNPKIFNLHHIKQRKAANAHILETGVGECIFLLDI